METLSPADSVADTKLININFHHGNSLRAELFPIGIAANIFSGNAQLTPKSGKAMMAWFERNGFPGIARENEWNAVNAEVENREFRMMLKELKAQHNAPEADP